MKYLSLINGVWKVRKDPNITNEEKNILNDRDPSNNELRKNTLDSIRSRSFEDANNEDALLAQSLYDQYALSDAIFISADISLPDNHGIINCRLNNEHQQIRF